MKSSSIRMLLLPLLVRVGTRLNLPVFCFRGLGFDPAEKENPSPRNIYRHFATA